MTKRLPYHVTDANTVDKFKLQLDKFWKDQYVYYHPTMISRVTQPEPETDLSISVNLSNNSIFILCYEDAGKEVQCACIRQPHLTSLDLTNIHRVSKKTVPVLFCE